MSIADNLSAIYTYKNDIKNAIVAKGVDMTGVALSGYSTKIGQIQIGGSIDFYECNSVDTATSSWTGYKWSQDSTTKQWSKSATLTQNLTYTRIQPITGISYSEDVTVKITEFYEGGIAFELWQTWDSSLNTVNFCFTPTDDSSKHYWFSGSTNQSNKVTGFIKPGTYYVGSSTGYSSGCDYSTDGGTNWSYWNIYYDGDNYHKFTADGSNPATITITENMSKVCIRYSI